MELTTLFKLLILGTVLSLSLLVFTNNNSSSSLNSYSFKDKQFALQLLDRFDEAPKHKKWWYAGRPPPEFKTLHLVKKDRNYCHKVRRQFINDPNFVFQDNMITDFSFKDTIVRPLIHGAYIDLMPELRMLDRRSKERFFFHQKVAIYFMHSQFQFKHKVGSEIACFNQMYNHIPGLPAVQAKDLCAMHVNEYIKKYKKRQHCFSHDIFLPKTYSMFIEEDCLDFFKKIDSPEYRESLEKVRIQFIRKIGDLHAAKGVEVVDEAEEARLRKVYQNGSTCGKDTRNVLVQRYIANPLLLEGRKFDFRIYMFIASTNPLIAYYHDGFLKLSVHRYAQNSTERNSFISNTLLAKDIFEAAAHGKKFEGMNETELRDFQTWTLDRLQDYLYKNKIIKNKNWLDNYLRPKFKQAMIHITRATHQEFLKHSSVCELMGWDYTLDDELTLWFLEANWNPALIPYSESRKILLTDMMVDIFEIMFNMLRSRMHRLVRLINRIIDDYPQGFNSIPSEDLRSLKQEYDKAMMNKLEPEFALDPANKFELIIDENLNGKGRYAGFIEEDCF